MHFYKTRIKMKKCKTTYTEGDNYKVTTFNGAKEIEDKDDMFDTHHTSDEERLGIKTILYSNKVPKRDNSGNYKTSDEFIKLLDGRKLDYGNRVIRPLSNGPKDELTKISFTDYLNRKVAEKSDKNQSDHNGVYPDLYRWNTSMCERDVLPNESKLDSSDDPDNGDLTQNINYEEEVAQTFATPDKTNTSETNTKFGPINYNLPVLESTSAY